MRVFAFVGKSGTGKSYKAFLVARDKGIDFIVDDGLLIGRTSILAGKSAKKESTKMASVKTAIISDAIHREEIKDALIENEVEKILIIGTSVKMTDQIRQALGLPEIESVTYITDVSTEAEIQLAKNSRNNEGKHVIPVPHMEVKKAFSGYFLDALKIFRRKGKNTDIIEKTIIRPTYSYIGKYDISKPALNQICEMTLKNIKDIARINKIKVDESGDGLKAVIEVVIFMNHRIDVLALRIQKESAEALTHMTGRNVYNVELHITGIRSKPRFIEEL